MDGEELKRLTKEEISRRIREGVRSCQDVCVSVCVRGAYRS
jgi:hypothetical protein